MTDEAKSAQEQFYAAIQNSQAVVRSLRKARTGHIGGTQEMLIINPNTPVPPMKRPSMMRVRAKDTGQFEAHLVLIHRLLNLSDEEGEIICIGRPPERREGGSFCDGMRGIWTRANKEPPRVTYLDVPLSDALTSRPVAVFLQLKDAPEDTPLGYIQVQLSNPDVCILFRKGF
jgi:hypothetical protein